MTLTPLLNSPSIFVCHLIAPSVRTASLLPLDAVHLSFFVLFSCNFLVFFLFFLWETVPRVHPPRFFFFAAFSEARHGFFLPPPPFTFFFLNPGVRFPYFSPFFTSPYPCFWLMRSSPSIPHVLILTPLCPPDPPDCCHRLDFFRDVYKLPPPPLFISLAPCRHPSKLFWPSLMR